MDACTNGTIYVRIIHTYHVHCIIYVLSSSGIHPQCIYSIYSVHISGERLLIILFKQLNFNIFLNHSIISFYKAQRVIPVQFMFEKKKQYDNHFQNKMQFGTFHFGNDCKQEIQTI